MTMNDPLKDELLASDPAFRILWDEHQDCERRLNEILHRSMPSQEDEQQEKQIKLHKLALKDRMEAMLRHHRESRVSV